MREKVGAIATQFTPLEWDAVADTGTGNLGATNKTYYLSAINRVGRNLLSAGKTVATVANDKIEITLSDTLVAPGEDLQRLILSAEDTGNSADAVQIAEIKYKLDDQVSTIALPAVFDLINPTDIITDIGQMSVTTFAALSALPVPINGQLRSVDDEAGQWYRYDSDASDWIPHYFPDPYMTIANTKDTYGSDQLLGADLIIPIPKIDTSGSQATSVVLRFEIQNDEEGSGGNAFSGEFNLRVAINGAVSDENGKFYGTAFNNLFKFVLVGYRRILTRTLDTSMLNAGVTQTWDAVYNKLPVPNDLLVGYSVVYDIYLDAPTINLNQAGYDDGDVLSISFDSLTRTGIPSELTALVGDDVVFGEGDKMVFVPYSLKSGAAIIGGLFFRSPDQAGVASSLIPDQADQALIINSAPGGSVRTSATPASLIGSEGIRCTISTESGFTEGSPVSDPYVLTTPASLVVTVNHPVGLGNTATIRSNYPDSQIAGRNDATWDNPFFRIYLFQGTTLYQKNTLIASNSAASQDVTIQNLDDFTLISGGVPSGSLIYGENFGLYEPLQATLGEAVGGALPADTYTVIILYVYTAPNTKITRINHEIALPGVLKLIPQTIFDVLGVFELWSNTHKTVALARTLESSQLTDGSVHLFADKNYAPYVFRNDLNLTDDGITAINPIGLGSFVPLHPLLKVSDASSFLTPAPAIRFGFGTTASYNALSDAIDVVVDSSIFNPPAINPNLLSAAGEFLKASNGELIVGP